MKTLRRHPQPVKTKRIQIQPDIPMSSAAASRNPDCRATDPSSPPTTVDMPSTSTPQFPSSSQPHEEPQPAHIFLSYPSRPPTSLTTTLPLLPSPLLSLFIHYHPIKSPINILLLFVPLGIVAGALNFGSDVLILSLNFLAIIPLAPLMTLAKRDLARGLGRVPGGLLNVCLGNGILWIVSFLMLFTVPRRYPML